MPHLRRSTILGFDCPRAHARGYLMTVLRTSTDPGAFFRFADYRAHHIAMLVECIVDDLQGWNCVRAQRKRFRIESSKTGFMDAAATAARRRAAQMLKEARIFLPARPAPGVIHRNKFMQRVVRHLADA